MLMLASFIVVLIGYFKNNEPKISYELTPKTIKFNHRRGQWQIYWLNVIRIGEVYADIQGERVRLPYLGIRLASIEPLAKSIPPRLANKLIHEQKELVRLAVKNLRLTIEQGAIHFDGFKTKEQLIKGPVGAWLHQSDNLALAYGYHLYLPEDSFDRDIAQFLSLLKSCHTYSAKQQEE
ncbi:DUF2982 domain-containing protein [Thalassotalea fonticola]|uniref:DUF2982 domain-containing protein n=1 Tax=Thalassotalea fonticola TaxID=3065649 RepID=A0ABZ0GQQ4_9GAMM|nr:DUF2982 domain-containing protein [Colwelliaceae bacterium S1-1]